MNIKGKLPSKKQTQVPDVATGVLGVIQLTQELSTLKNDLTNKVDSKIQEADEAIELTLSEAKKATKEAERAVQLVEDLKEEALDLIAEIKQGEKGEDADEEAIEERVFARIKIPGIDEDSVVNKVLSRVPVLDEKKLKNDILSLVPKRSELKLIQERFEVDPHEVLESMLELEDESFTKLRGKLMSGDNLHNTIKSTLNQMGKYTQVSGGGFNNIYANGSLVSDGLTGLDFSGDAVTSVTKNNTTGIITVTLDGSGANPGGSDTQVQFNDGGAFGGNAGLVYNKTTRQLSLVSQDIPNGVARLQLQSYDETSTVGGDYSEVIRMDMMTNSAKAALAWRDSTGSSKVWVQAHDYLYWYESIVVSAVDTSADTLTVVDRDMPTGWQVTLTTTGTLPSPLTVLTNYYVRVISANVISLYPTSADASANTNKINLTTSGSGTITVVPDNDYNYNRHKHWSVEVSKANGEKHTRFSIPYGYDTTEISVFDANMNVIGNMFRVLGNAGNNRQILFGQNPPNSYLPGNYGASPRWSLTCNDTAESGSNVGSDYQINRFGDNGAYIASALFIKRDTGNVGIATTSPQARFHVDRTTNAVGILSLNSTAGGNTAANFLGESVTSGSRVYQARITGDTTARWSVDASGNTEWGAGGASARDTNLYRASANNLKTDDNFTALSLISDKITASSSAGVVIESANGTDVGLLGAGNTANVTWYGSHNFDTVTASRVAQFGASKTLESSTVTTTQLANMPYVYYRNHTASQNTGGGTVTISPTSLTAGLIDGTNKSFIEVQFVGNFGAAAETKTFNCTINDGTNTLSPASTGFTTTATSQNASVIFRFYRNTSSTGSGNGQIGVGQGLGTGALMRVAATGIATPATFDWSQAVSISVTGNSTTSNNLAINNVIVTIG